MQKEKGTRENDMVGYSVVSTMNMNLGKLKETVEGRGCCCCTMIHEVAERWTQPSAEQQLSLVMFNGYFDWIDFFWGGNVQLGEISTISYYF